MSFNTALSGLKAASSELEVVSNNVANASTVGFKNSRAEFSDIFASAGAGVGATAIGSGVTLSNVSQQFAQGSLATTGNSLDLAISGNGFFVLDNDGTTTYTREGAFGINRDGVMVNKFNDRLQIYPPASEDDATVFQTGIRQDLEIPQGEGEPAATTILEIGLNLSSDDTAIPGVGFDPTDSDTYNRSTSMTVYDSLGTEHVATTYYQKAGSNIWRAFVFVDGNEISGGDTDPNDPAFDATTDTAYTPHTLTFNSSGRLASLAVGGVTTAVPPRRVDYTTTPYDPGGGASPLELSIDYSSATTQFAGPFVISSLNQDGLPTGRLIGLSVSDEGVIFARFSNGLSETIGKVAVSDFDNPQGLTQLGDTRWAESFNSGPPRPGEAGSGQFGAIKSGSLEGSNVELTEELIKLITAQRNFQANARAIETANQITQTIIQIR